jgi:catechol 2,3-dioxygenase-like lactoylglutathione lyase family enzyme
MRLNVVTLGVRDLPRSLAFYQALGMRRRMAATGDAIAFLDGGGVVLALFGWDNLANDATLPRATNVPGFRGITLAHCCRTDQEVDDLLARALAAGGTLLKPAHRTAYGGYSGYFADPDGHAWEAVRAPGFGFTEDMRLVLPD